VAWLMRGEQVLATVEVAGSFGARARGLLGRDDIDGAMLIRPTRSVHTLGMRFAIDVAFCDADLLVLRTVCMKPWRLTRPCWRARCVIEARAGAFDRWRLRPGDVLEVRD